MTGVMVWSDVSPTSSTLRWGTRCGGAACSVLRVLRFAQDDNGLVAVWSEVNPTRASLGWGTRWWRCLLWNCGSFALLRMTVGWVVVRSWVRPTSNNGVYQE